MSFGSGIDYLVKCVTDVKAEFTTFRWMRSVGLSSILSYYPDACIFAH